MQTIVRAHEDTATSCCWRSDGGIVTAGLDGQVAFWRYDPEAETRHAEAATAPKDGKKDAKLPPILSCTKRIERAHSLGVVSVAANPAGSVLVTSGINNDVSIWDLGSYTRSKVLELTASDVWKLAFNPVASQFASGGHGGSINLFSTDTGAKMASIETSAEFINNVAYSPDGRYVAACGVDGSLHVADVEAGTVVSTVRNAHLLPIQSVSFSHDGTTLYTGSYDRSIHVYDVSNLGSGSSASSAAGAGAAGADRASSALICSLVGHLHWVTSVAASPATHHIASASADRSVRVWDARKRECVHSFEGHGERVWSVSWNPAGTRLATATDAGALGLFPLSAFV